MATHDNQSSSSDHRGVPDSAPQSEGELRRAIQNVHEVVEGKSGVVPSVVLDRQDELMARTPVDGRAPGHTWRRTGWTVLAIAIAGAVITGIITAFSKGADGPTVLGAVLIAGLMLLIGGAPVVFAGRSRARQQAAARKMAEAEEVKRQTSPQ